MSEPLQKKRKTMIDYDEDDEDSDASEVSFTFYDEKIFFDKFTAFNLTSSGLLHILIKWLIVHSKFNCSYCEIRNSVDIVFLF